MIEVQLADPEGVRFVPAAHTGVGVLVLAGSSGRVDHGRARLLAGQGAMAESIRWFGGPGEQPGPWEVPIELFLDRIAELRRECDRVVLVGTSFGAEAALVTASLSDLVDGVVAFAPTDVVWAGVTPEGRMTSHWCRDGVPLPFVPFVESWTPVSDPPSYRELYRQSCLHAPKVATIAVERIRDLVLVAGGDDQVWPSVEQAERIRLRRASHGRSTTVVLDPEAGHRAILPGEDPVAEGQVMRRGGNETADRRLGAAAWPAVLEMLRVR